MKSNLYRPVDLCYDIKGVGTIRAEIGLIIGKL